MSEEPQSAWRRDDRLSEQEKLMLDLWDMWLTAWKHFNPGQTPSYQEIWTLFIEQGPAEAHALVERYADALEREVRDTMCN